MKKIFLGLGILATFLMACNQATEPQMETFSEQESTELIINLISDPTSDPHSTLMGLHLAQKVLANDMEATVFMNVHGVKLMSPGADSLAFHGENLQEVLKALMSSGGTVRACPHCMEAHDIKAEQLLQGVEVMNDQTMMEKIRSNPTVCTY